MFVPPARRIAAEHVEPPEADGRSDAEADVDSTPIQHEDRRSSPPQRFREGYAWAEEVDVQDYRECRRWDGDSGRDGCLAYVEDQGDDRRIAYQRLDDRAGDVEPRGY